MKLKLICKAVIIVLAFSLVAPTTAMATPLVEGETERLLDVVPQTESEQERETLESETESEQETETSNQNTEAQYIDPYVEEPYIEEPYTEENLEETEEPEEQEKPFGVTKIEKKYGLSKSEELKIYEKKSVKSRPVGKLQKNGLCFIIEEDEKGWAYIESAEVRGFVKVKNLRTGEKADNYVKKKKEKNLKKAECLISPLKNKAWTYTKTTAQKIVVKKAYAVSKVEAVRIQEGKKETSRVIGVLPKDGLCYVLADADEKWIYVESGYVRGFVRREDLIRGKKAAKLVAANQEENYELAQELILMEENKAGYYSLTTVREVVIYSTLRDSIVDYAMQFLGNAYIWGGTSLVSGADCSGFVQSIYREFGYLIPRVAEDQARVGTKIPVSEAAPGDLIFYARSDGYIYHVVMYIGNGQDIEAHSSARGTIINNVNYANAVWAMRIVEDEIMVPSSTYNAESMQGDTEVAREQDYGKHLGNFTLTAYCSCPTCCGVWSGGPTASGVMPVQDRTIAMGGIEFGTRLIINGQIYTVEDRGTPYGHADIYMNNHQDALVFGRQQADVYLAN